MKSIAIAASLVLVVALLGCTKAEPPTAAPAPKPDPNPDTSSDQGGPVAGTFTCTTLDECKQRDNQEVRVVGTYRKFETGAGKGRTWSGQIQIDLGNGGPVLGRYWHDESKRDAAEVQRFEGQLVAVVGRFRDETPPNPANPPHAAALSVPALLDITTIELAGAAPPAPPAPEDPASAAAADERPDPKDLPRL